MITDIQRELSQYLAQFPDETCALQPLLAQLNEEPSHIFSRSTMRGHITTSMLVLSANLQSVLLIEHLALNEWLQPGGHYEGPGSLLVSALREVQEETGLSDVLIRPVLQGDFSALLDVDTHIIPDRPTRGEGEHFHHDFIYLGISAGDEKLVPQLEEVKGVRWFPLEQLHELPNTRFKRISEKLHAIF